MSPQSRTGSETVTITYSRPDLLGPVYVVSNITSPGWELQHMALSSEKTETGESIFYAVFEDIPSGAYQYKIRIGEDEWVLDDSKEITTDNEGNQNNVCYVGGKDSDASAGPTPVNDKGTSKDQADTIKPSKEATSLLPHEELATLSNMAPSSPAEQQTPMPESPVEESPMTYEEVIQAIAVQEMVWSVVPIDTESESSSATENAPVPGHDDEEGDANERPLLPREASPDRLSEANSETSLIIGTPNSEEECIFPYEAGDDLLSHGGGQSGIAGHGFDGIYTNCHLLRQPSSNSMVITVAPPPAQSVQTSDEPFPTEYLGYWTPTPSIRKPSIGSTERGIAGHAYDNERPVRSVRKAVTVVRNWVDRMFDRILALAPRWNRKQRV